MKILRPLDGADCPDEANTTEPCNVVVTVEWTQVPDTYVDSTGRGHCAGYKAVERELFRECYTHLTVWQAQPVGARS